MVARDHHRRDTRRFAYRDRLLRLWTRQVHKPYQAEQCEVLFEVFRIAVTGQLVPTTIGDREHTTPITRHRLGNRQESRMVDRGPTLVFHDRHATVEHGFGRPLCVGDEAGAVAVECRHPLAVERQLRAA